MATNALNAVTGITYFTAFIFKQANPPISAVNTAIMVNTVGNTAVLKGIIFKHQYDKVQTPRLT
jgi:hypothetical protein